MQVGSADFQREVRVAVDQMRVRLISWFAGSLIAAILLVWMASNTYGAGAWIVRLLCILALFLSFFFGCLLWDFFSKAPHAIRDAATWSIDSQSFRRAYGIVFEIPWGWPKRRGGGRS